MSLPIERSSNNHDKTSSSLNVEEDTTGEAATDTATSRSPVQPLLQAFSEDINKLIAKGK